ncbi:MAG: three-Cys-motif partner protein TcmP [Chloroflexi bacterium]|nr:three-Cys-motif partner protein TcmP [Chloroflexota bacterium]
MCEHCATQLHDDGHPILELGEWSPNKLFYLGQYSDIFTTGMSRRWPHRAYIDLFAGPGLNSVRGTGEIKDGSPLVALKQRTAFTHYVFVDSDAGHVSALEARSRNLAPNSDKKVIYGDCNSPVVLSQIRTAVPDTALCLTFVDPFAFDIRFATLRALAEALKTDLIVVVHIGNMKRALDYQPKSLDDFFGNGGEWYQTVQKAGKRGATRALLDYYKDRLASLGYLRDKHQSETLVKGVPRYYMMFATRHPRGLDFWRKATRRTMGGQGRLL